MADKFTNSIASLNLSASNITSLTGWPDIMTDDYLTNLQNFIEIARNSDDLLELVEQNEANIIVNAANIATNADNITTNADNITTNADNIATNADNITTNADDISTNADNIIIVADDLSDHELLNSAHGVTGDNVGTEDFAQPVVGGVVLLAALIADLTAIATADIAAAPVAYDQVYTQSVTDLTNENKAKINEIVLKVNAIISGQISANQMAAI
jgi:hypothetical protein